MLHVSTAYVAGQRRAGHVMEAELRDDEGFQTAYEESKHTTERLLHAWAEEQNRSVTVFRPSLLVTDRPVPQGLPGQPTDVLIQLIERLVHARAAQDESLRVLLGGPGSGGETQPEVLQFRVEGDAEGTLNLLQAEYAAQVMVLAAAQPQPASGVRTLHVTHPQSVAFATAAAALQSRFPGLTLSIVPALPHPTPQERLAAEHGARMLTFSAQRRTYDRTNLLAAINDFPDPEPVDYAYLARAFGRADAPLPV
jgi:nucleoside-diphosphate-sugar epimerase